jgi:hypothetical protein
MSNGLDVSDQTHQSNLKAIFHCSRFARAGGADFENLLTRAKRTLMANGLYAVRDPADLCVDCLDNALVNV